ncbi:MAG: hypothetical protein ED556_05295 [Winogradskyella sp.]|uniref:hypothetical protein n=1 Tax=Winogradskyella sp. TaxID=1883156 RepID=UPI000F4040CA|nr:hypothetical protein [Winogradskyella sp.]RNC86839.1 MAG: hypothetical protein ED556_05295 [Winogradskyella sp.]
MKKIIAIVTLLLIVGVGNSQNNEKRIKFNTGTLKICSSANMKISGYDGDEVIIKSVNNTTRFTTDFKFSDKNSKLRTATDSSLTSPLRVFFTNSDKKRELEKGLKPLGNKSTNPADNLYLDITENPGELILRDYSYAKSGKSNQNALTLKGSFYRIVNKYELLIPNSIKLLWNIEDCAKKNSNTFFVASDSKPWKLENFKGEAEISASYNSISITDVSGPVVANTIGGNITVVFDDITPTNLYSLISNDGYIDVTIPKNASIKVDAVGNRILSDIDFKVLSETISDGTKGMDLELNSGKTKMKLSAGSGSVYLRKG